MLQKPPWNSLLSLPAGRPICSAAMAGEDGERVTTAAVFVTGAGGACRLVGIPVEMSDGAGGAVGVFLVSSISASTITCSKQAV